MAKRSLMIAAIAAAGLVFIGANAHLLYVAITTEPECVAHLKAPAPETGQFRAAKPSC